MSVTNTLWTLCIPMKGLGMALKGVAKAFRRRTGESDRDCLRCTLAIHFDMQGHAAFQLYTSSTQPRFRLIYADRQLPQAVSARYQLPAVPDQRPKSHELPKHVAYNWMSPTSDKMRPLILRLYLGYFKAILGVY